MGGHSILVLKWKYLRSCIVPLLLKICPISLFTFEWDIIFLDRPSIRLSFIQPSSHLLLLLLIKVLAEWGTINILFEPSFAHFCNSSSPPSAASGVLHIPGVSLQFSLCHRRSSLMMRLNFQGATISSDSQTHRSPRRSLIEWHKLIVNFLLPKRRRRRM